MKPKPIMDDADAVRAEAQEKARKLAEKLHNEAERERGNSGAWAAYEDSAGAVERAFGLGAK